MKRWLVGGALAGLALGLGQLLYLLVMVDRTATAQDSVFGLAGPFLVFESQGNGINLGFGALLVVLSGVLVGVILLGLIGRVFTWRRSRH